MGARKYLKNWLLFYVLCFFHHESINQKRHGCILLNINPILHGGGSNWPPYLKARKMIQTWYKGIFWQILIVAAYYLCFWSWIITIFDSKKDKKIVGEGGSNRGIEGSPLWIVCGKNCQRKIFWKFQKEIPKMAYPGPF